MKLKEIPRTATFAWSPTAGVPRVVTGTAAGAIDPDFSSSTHIELWNLDLAEKSSDSVVVQEPVARLDAAARFHALEFSADGAHVAGALENGILEAWRVSPCGEAPKLTSIGVSTAHSGPAKALAWNPNFVGRLASGGANGQVFVYDIDDLANPTTPAAQPARHDEIAAVAWNNRVTHILASGGSTGFTSIWDLKKRREVIHLHFAGSSGNRLPVSAVAWHPSNSTKLATAMSDDTEPVILLWDLRNANAPERVLSGHQRGVLSLDWCRYDEALMLSSGRDNRTLLWDPTDGTMVGEYPVSVEWTFKTKFNPVMPDLFASATFDGKVVVQTLQDCAANSGDVSSAAAPASAASGDDFWDSASVMVSVHPTFARRQAPAWLRRPVSARFAFGGKMVVVRTVNGKSTVSIDTVNHIELPEPARQFNELFAAGNITAIADLHASSSDRDWTILRQLCTGGDLLSEFRGNLASSPNAIDEDIFDNLSVEPQDTQYAPDTEFSLFTGENDDVTRLVLAGQIDEAVSKLIALKKPGDALLLASYGSPLALSKAQNAYLMANASNQPYLRAAWAVSNGGEHITDLAQHVDVAGWQMALSALITQPNLKGLAGKLGQRLIAAGQRDNAMQVFLSGGNVGSAAALWLAELPGLEQTIQNEGKYTPYIAYVLALQQTIEKITVAISATSTSSADAEDYKALNDAVRDYADVVSSQGDLTLAKKLLDMLPAEYQQEKSRLAGAQAKSYQQSASQVTSTVSSGAKSYIPAQTATSVTSPNATRAAPTMAPSTVPSVPTVPAFQPRIIPQTRTARPNGRASTLGAPSAAPAPPPTSAMTAASSAAPAASLTALQVQPSAPQPTGRYVPTTPIETPTAPQNPYNFPRIARAPSRQPSVSAVSGAAQQSLQQPVPPATPVQPTTSVNPYAQFTSITKPQSGHPGQAAPAPAAPVIPGPPPPGPAMKRPAAVARPSSRTAPVVGIPGTNPYASALTGASTAAASVQASAALAAESAAANAANAALQSTSGQAGLGGRPSSTVSKPPSHGWNDLPTLPKSATRRTPAAPKILKPVHATQFTREGSSVPPPPRADTPLTSQPEATVNQQQPEQQQPASNGGQGANPYTVPNAASNSAIASSEPLAAPTRAPTAPRVNPYAPRASPTVVNSAVSPAPAAPIQASSEKRNPYAPAKTPVSLGPTSAPPQGPPRSQVASPNAQAPAHPFHSSGLTNVTYAAGPSNTPSSESPRPPPGASLARGPTPAPAAVARAQQSVAPTTSSNVYAPPTPVAPAAANPAEVPSRLEAATPLTSAANAVRAQMKYPIGDRSHIPEAHRPIYDRVSHELARVKPFVYERFTKQYVDSERRFDILFDQLNNGLLAEPLVSEILSITDSIAQREFETASQTHRQIVLLYADASRSWAPGLKRLIAMSQAVPI